MAIPAETLAIIAEAAKILAAAAPLFQSNRDPTAAELQALLDEVEASRLARDQALDELRDVIDRMPG